MTDIYLEFNSDIIISPNGSVYLAEGWDQIRERIIRRFLTNSATPLPNGTLTPADYIFDPAYGLSAGALIDQNPSPAFMRDLTRRMRSAVLLDAAVDPGAVPSVTVKTPQIGTVEVFVTVKLASGTEKNVSIVLGGTGSDAIANPESGGMTYQPFVLDDNRFGLLDQSSAE